MNVKLVALLSPVGACVVLPTAAALCYAAAGDYAGSPVSAYDLAHLALASKTIGFPPGFVIARKILHKDKLAVADDEHSMKVGIGGLQLVGHAA